MEKRGKKRSKSIGGFSVGKSDPLFQIFERHLYEFNYETRENFVNAVVKEYLLYVSRETRALVPHGRKALLESSIADDVSDMLVRKIYGCLTVEENDLAPQKTGKKKSAGEVGAKAKHSAAIAAENAEAMLSPQEIKKRISKLIR